MKRLIERNFLGEYKLMVIKNASEMQNLLEDDHEYGRGLHHQYHGILHLVLQQRKIIHRRKCSPRTMLTFLHAPTVEYHYFNGSDVWVLAQERTPEVLVKKSVSVSIGNLDMESFRRLVRYLSGSGLKVRAQKGVAFDPVRDLIYK